jgi:hypothetical protein
MAIRKSLMTADELLRLPDDNMRHELVRGELRTMPPAGGEHGFVGAELLGLVREYVRARDMGFTFNADTGFRISRNPDTVRAPDVAFIAKGRLPGGRLPSTFPESRSGPRGRGRVAFRRSDRSKGEGTAVARGWRTPGLGRLALEPFCYRIPLAHRGS